MSNDRLKFRAWDKRTKQFYPYSFALLGEALLLGALEDWLIEQDPEGGRLVRLAEVDIVQWTGLYDNTGTEIYEGDRVVWGDDNVETVKFDDGMYVTDTCCLDSDGASVMAVIGNIYDA